MSHIKNDYFIKIYTLPLNKVLTMIMKNMTSEEMDSALITHIEDSIGFDKVKTWEISKLKSSGMESKKLKNLLW